MALYLFDDPHFGFSFFVTFKSHGDFTVFNLKKKKEKE